MPESHDVLIFRDSLIRCNNCIYLLTMKNEDHFGRSYFVNCGKIVYCEADGSYSDISFQNGEKQKISKNLIQISMSLPADMFFRCHRSFLVNTYRITGFDILNKTILLDGKYAVPISSSRLKKIDCKISEFSKSNIINMIRQEDNI